ncbi:MAG TPA: hypothetical protein VIK33_18250 [Anaerolineae bacterium]
MPRDADVGGPQGEGEVVGESLDALQARAEGRGEVELHPAWGDDAAGDAGGGFVVSQHHLDSVGLQLQQLSHRSPRKVGVPLSYRTSVLLSSYKKSTGA